MALKRPPSKFAGPKCNQCGQHKGGTAALKRWEWDGLCDDCRSEKRRRDYEEDLPAD